MATQAAPNPEKIALDLFRKDLAEAGSKFAAGLKEYQYQWYEESSFSQEPNRKRYESLKDKWLESVKMAITVWFEKLIALDGRRKPSEVSKLILEVIHKECEPIQIFKSGRFLALGEFLPAWLEHEERSAYYIRDAPAYYDKIRGQVAAIVEYLEQEHVVNAALGSQVQEVSKKAEQALVEARKKGDEAERVVSELRRKTWRPDDWEDWPEEERSVFVMLLENPTLKPSAIGARLDASKFGCPFGDYWERELTQPGAGATWISRVRKKVKGAIGSIPEDGGFTTP